MTVKVWIGVDDTCPALETGAKPIFSLLEKWASSFPKARFTHFVPANYSMRYGFWWGFKKRCRQYFGTSLGLEPNPSTRLDANRDWIEQFMAQKIARAELHGLYHVDFETGSAEEFRSLSATETGFRLDESMRIFDLSKLPLPRLISPPGWSVTPTLLEACQKRNLSLASSLFDSYGNHRAGLALPNGFFPVRVNGVMCVPRNVSIDAFDKTALDALLERRAVIGIHAHYRNIGVTNGITSQNLERLSSIIGYLEQNDSVDFVFAHELIENVRD